VAAAAEHEFAGRGVPDVSGDADPETGYLVRVMDRYGDRRTSAVAPLWAGLIALINQQIGKPVGFVQPRGFCIRSALPRSTTSRGQQRRLSGGPELGCVHRPGKPQRRGLVEGAAGIATAGAT